MTIHMPSGKLSAALLLGATLALSGCVTFRVPLVSGPVTQPELQAANASGFDAQLNAARVANGLAPMQRDPNLVRAALAHSTEMAQTGVMTHTSVDGTDAHKRLRKFGNCLSATSENIASGYSSEAKVFQVWMNSPDHQKNMMNPKYNRFGLAQKNGYWTMTLAGPCK